MTEEIMRVLSLCIVLAGVETLHGIARATLLVPRVGKKRALKVSIVAVSILVFGLCYLMVPGIETADAMELFGIGMILALFMAGFDVILARRVLRQPWKNVFRDFDPRTGNYLIFGLLVLVYMPYQVMRLY